MARFIVNSKDKDRVYKKMSGSNDDDNKSINKRKQDAPLKCQIKQAAKIKKIQQMNQLHPSIIPSNSFLSIPSMKFAHSPAAGLSSGFFTTAG